MDYKKHIGDGKLPNRYGVFHYDEKFAKDDDGNLVDINIIEENEINNLLGEFKTYKEALNCVYEKAYLPRVTIEDRVTGFVYESLVIVCPCCNKEEYETYEDINYTREHIEKRGLVFG
jgi:hypothetical protein